MTILDLDLDAFVRPVADLRHDNHPRLPNDEYEVETLENVKFFLREQCRLDGSQLGAAREHHVEVLDIITDRINLTTLTPPFVWIHIDAHDDLQGLHTDASTSANYLYHCIRRQWLEKLVMVFPPKVFSFPKYVLHDDPVRIEFDNFTVPLAFSDTNKFVLHDPPDFVFLAHSPAFTPQKADELHEYICTLFHE